MARGPGIIFGRFANGGRRKNEPVVVEPRLRVDPRTCDVATYLGSTYGLNEPAIITLLNEYREHINLLLIHEEPSKVADVVYMSARNMRLL
jgi:hypothetical protein